MRFLLFEGFTDKLFLDAYEFLKFVSDAMVLGKEGSVSMKLLQGHFFPKDLEDNQRDSVLDQLINLFLVCNGLDYLLSEL